MMDGNGRWAKRRMLPRKMGHVESGKDEIVRAVNKIFLSNELKGGINADEFSSYLDTWDIPEPDLFIRTGSDKTLSNFMLWEMTYTEFYFTNILWPDFNEEELKKAIDDFSERERRYGRIEE